jgi:spore maturation protein CgeB
MCGWRGWPPDASIGIDMKQPLRILYVGPISHDGTCLHRMEALRHLGNEVDGVSTSDLFRECTPRLLRSVFGRLGRHLDLRGVNQKILRRLTQKLQDVLWVDKGLIIDAATLQRAKLLQPRLMRISYSPDDMLNPKVNTPRYLATIPHYDLHVTTKSYNVSELQHRGAANVFFAGNAYNPVVHRPLSVNDIDRKRLGVMPVSFAGAYERDRSDMMETLARDGVPVVFRCYPCWPRRRPRPANLRIVEGYVAGDDYARFLCGGKIALGFLHKGNRDRQTTRSVEIPACGAFLLAERTDEHLGLFREGVEAEFFGDYAELLRKCRYYLEHEEERKCIAHQGYLRCLKDDYSNEGRLREVLRHVRN